LQQEKVDLLILPDCDGDTGDFMCSAEGRILNDDGEIFETEGN